MCVQEGECEELLSALSTRLLYLLPKTVASGTFDFAAPCLAALSHLLPTPPARQQGGLDAELGARLVVVLAACQQRPELAVAAAALSPALAKCGAAHAELLQAVLCERGPLTQHAGLEAYVVYARASASHPDLVTAAIPPRMRDPGEQGGWVWQVTRGWQCKGGDAARLRLGLFPVTAPPAWLGLLCRDGCGGRQARCPAAPVLAAAVPSWRRQAGGSSGRP